MNIWMSIGLGLLAVIILLFAWSLCRIAAISDERAERLYTQEQEQ